MNANVVYIPFSPQDNRQIIPHLVECYREVFAEEPWNEWKKCSVCGAKWGLGEKDLLRSINYEHCGETVFDFWPTKTVEEDIAHEITSDASCWLALSNTKVIGFSWGYPIAPQDLEKKLQLLGVANRLHRMFDNIERVAYQDEIGVLKEFRGQKIGKSLNIRRVNDFINQGLKAIVCRTKTNPPTVTYLWYTQKLGYDVIAEYNDLDKRVILARSLLDFEF
ncbi:MAG: GNAT family N-acetyltransferase [bacterium]